MKRRLDLATWVAAAVALAGSAGAQEPVSSTFESYFTANRGTAGASHYLSWDETTAKLDGRTRFTFSYEEMKGKRTFDEFCARFDLKQGMLRLGRIRTEFGLSDWSELLYNGFNHLPLIKIADMGDGLRLVRDDSGLEYTCGTPDLQLQAALMDSDLSTQQILPKRLDHSSLRLQTNRGQVILGLDYLSALRNSSKVYGLDLRWATPHTLVRGEFMRGDSEEGPSSGYYVDAEYRLPGLPRSQLVGRTEMVSEYSSRTFLHTVGLRQVVSPTITVNLNYGWMQGAPNFYIASSGLDGWTIRTMFQVRF